jgi:hypothetical protein
MRQGSLLVEVSVAMGFAALLSLVLMKASLLAIGGNQWTIMQTLTDAYLTRETALANRLPYAELTKVGSDWPDSAVDDPPRISQTVTLGRLAGGSLVTGSLTRFRANETAADDADTRLTVWRVYSVLTYYMGDKQYVKSRSTLRMQ